MSVRLILGLGNPGERYAHTRHNVGFDVSAELLRRRGFDGWLRRPGCELAVITSQRTAVETYRLVVLARPQAFMNRSGEVAAALLADLELEPRHMLVVVDDIDLPLGVLRLRARGGPGTHNGLRDICDAVGTDFPRLRVGIKGTAAVGDLADYVLGPFDAEESAAAAEAIDRAADAVESVIRDGVERSMSSFNRRQSPAEPTSG